jgi:heme-degrading monooxygenase HmoA
MVHVLIHHRVTDYGRWKEAFDSDLTNRKRAGETGYHVFHSLEDPHDIVVLSDWQTIEEARKFITSDDLRQRMKEAGVQGSPHIQYLEDASAVHRTSAD